MRRFDIRYLVTRLAAHREDSAKEAQQAARNVVGAQLVMIRRPADNGRCMTV